MNSAIEVIKTVNSKRLKAIKDKIPHDLHLRVLQACGYDAIAAQTEVDFVLYDCERHGEEVVNYYFQQAALALIRQDIARIWQSQSRDDDDNDA